MGDPGALPEAVGLVDQDWFPGLPGDLYESPAVGKSLQIDENNLRPLILDEISKQVVFIYIQLVPDRDEFVEPDILIGQKPEITQPDAPALGQDGDRTQGEALEGS